MSSSTSSDLVTGKKFLKKLLYVQHVDEEKDTASETPDRYVEEYLLVIALIAINSPIANLSLLKSTVKERIADIRV